MRGLHDEQLDARLARHQHVPPRQAVAAAALRVIASAVAAAGPVTVSSVPTAVHHDLRGRASGLKARNEKNERTLRF